MSLEINLVCSGEYDTFTVHCVVPSKDEAEKLVEYFNEKGHPRTSNKHFYVEQTDMVLNVKEYIKIKENESNEKIEESLRWRELFKKNEINKLKESIAQLEKGL